MMLPPFAPLTSESEAVMSAFGAITVICPPVPCVPLVALACIVPVVIVVPEPPVELMYTEPPRLVPSAFSVVDKLMLPALVSEIKPPAPLVPVVLIVPPAELQEPTLMLMLPPNCPEASIWVKLTELVGAFTTT